MSKNEHQPASRGLHKDWRAWAVVALMLAGMAVYIFTLDEELVLGEPEQQQAPAAAE